MKTKKPLKDMVIDILPYLQSKTQSYLVYNADMLDVFNGGLLKKLQDSMRTELSPESYARSAERLVAINLILRLVDKLSGVYNAEPTRICGTDGDQELLDSVVEALDFNSKMAFANRMLNLHKATTLEPYYDEDEKTLACRVVPADRILPYSDSLTNPDRPNVFIKLVGDILTMTPVVNYDGSKGEAPTMALAKVPLYFLYSETEFYPVTKDGIHKPEYLPKNGVGQDGTNPSGIMPFVYIKASETELIPAPDTSLLPNTLVVCKLLSDMAYAAKILSHSMIVLINLEGQLSAAPDRASHFFTNDEGATGAASAADIKTLDPKINIQETLMLITGIVQMMLESYSIKSDAIGRLAPGDAASGISKAIDQADISAVRKTQVALMKKAERQWWRLYVSEWNRLVDEDMLSDLDGNPETRKFSDDFSVAIDFQDPQPMKSELQQLQELDLALSLKLTSRRLSIRTIFPSYTDQQIDDLITEIDEETAAKGALIPAVPTGTVVGDQPVVQPPKPGVPGETDPAAETPTGIPGTGSSAPGADVGNGTGGGK